MKLKKHSMILIAIILVITSLIFVEGNFRNVKGDWVSSEPIYIRVDGTIEPSNSPISTVDTITYTLTDDIIGNTLSNIGMITVERDNIVLDGKDHILIQQ